MKLKEIASIRTGLVLSRKKAAPYDEQKKRYQQITLKSFSNTTTLQREYFDEFLSTESIDDKYISRAGDIVVRLRKPNVAVYIDEKSAGLVIPSLMCIVRVKESSVNSAYLAHYLNSTPVRKMLEREIKGTTIPMIKTKDLENIDVVLPSLEVQNKTVGLMRLSAKEIELTEKLKQQKEQFSQAVLDKIVTNSMKDK